MMRLSIASLTLVSAAEPSWKEWKFNYGVAYNGDDEDAKRQQVYEENVRRIEAHNAQGKSWTLAVNAFADRTRDEFVARFLSSPNKTRTPDGLFHETLPEASLPSSVDWVKQGVFNPVRDQLNGDCWAHSAVGVMESNWAIATSKLVELTEQQLCDCSDAGTCDGGYEDKGVKWYQDHKACTRASYPYTGKEGSSCKESSCTAGIPKGAVTDQVWVNNDASSLKSALAGRPTTASLYGHGLDQFYSSGVLDTDCTGDAWESHAVVAAGYGTENGEGYFLIRNSWGSTWGENGYARLKQSGNPLCLFNVAGSYPVFNGSPTPQPGPSPHPSPAPGPAPGPSPSPGVCSDLSGWTDSSGETCSDFASKNWCTSSGGEGDGWHSSWGSISDYPDSSGKTAREACCACGGGSAPSGCHDISGWSDSHSETCYTFESKNWCTSSGGEGDGWSSSWGRITDYPDSNGNTAHDACCACGGGGSKSLIV